MTAPLDHPCKETCSGWKQGYDKGAAALDTALKEVDDVKRIAGTVALENAQLRERVRELEEEGAVPSHEEILELADSVLEPQLGVANSFLEQELARKVRSTQYKLQLAVEAAHAYANAMRVALENGRFPDKSEVSRRIERILTKAKARETLEKIK